MLAEIDAVTLDFYNTLAYHRQGDGRGATLMEYLARQGVKCDPWEHQVLYDVFERHAEDYSPDLSADAKRRYLVRFTERVFERLNVRELVGAAADHATNVWALLGPQSLALFSDVLRVLEVLRSAAYPLALVSNWQCGLRHFCVELGLADAFDHVVVSAEVGSQKPDPEIFHIACRRLGVPPGRALHVGDAVVDDIEGAHNAGMRALLVRRGGSELPAEAPTIAGLHELPRLLGLGDA
ncbi:MAG: HAD family hydrolase [Gemmatimonadota bacterium]|nr:MAG: HAD family hydrolase [Gemmatimonadota bacterium]